LIYLKNLKKDKSQSIENCEYLLCTGLFEKYDEDLNYYKDLFEKNINKQMVCTNPDLIVDKGNKRELCAGSVAMVFEKMGGKVTYFGKPYP
jgi:ribonucleotide monophosphatase NagD (HAD superfamily)